MPTRSAAPSRFARVGTVLAVVVLLVTAGVIVFARDRAHADAPPTTIASASTTSTTTTSTTVPGGLAHVVPPGPLAVYRHLALGKVLGGPISPKSVVATNTGLVFAQNMMYRHTDTIYNSNGVLQKTLSDAVNLGAYGVTGRPGYTRGAPVEAAVTPDGRHVWISNYSMYGAGSGPEGSDTCTPASARAAGNTPSYLYRISTKTLSIDGVAPAGLVPKFLQVTPDGKYVVTSNWCSWDVTITSTATNRLVADLPVGAYPRGIAISPDSSTAYVAIMGSNRLAEINLHTMRVVGYIVVGSNVRHVVISPINPRYLFASLNAPGDVVKVDTVLRRVVAVRHTGSGCRSLAISTDGTALFVVNYDSNTMTMLRADNLAIIQTVRTGTHPVGITYDGTTGRVWVAVYTGAIMIFNTMPS